MRRGRRRLLGISIALVVATPLLQCGPLVSESGSDAGNASPDPESGAPIDAAVTEPDGRLPVDARAEAEASNGGGTQGDDGPSPDAGTRQDVLAVMKSVADWQIGQFGATTAKSWIESTFYAGLMATYRATGDPKYLAQIKLWGNANQWSIGTNADDQCAAQTYLEVYDLDHTTSEITKTRSTLDAELAQPMAGRKVWWWCDALFMAPAVFAKASAATSSSSYVDGMNTMFWDTTAALFDPASSLFFRDAGYLTQKCPNGEKMFWSRGNGWVVAGLARVLEVLPASYVDRGKYVDLLTSMATKLTTLQRSDGFWSSCLTDTTDYPEPETSGTAAIVYALAWGVNHAVLDRSTFGPAARKGWNALVSEVEPSGKLGYVQGVGAAPGHAAKTDTAAYGTGLFLLAGSEMAWLRN